MIGALRCSHLISLPDIQFSVMVVILIPEREDVQSEPVTGLIGKRVSAHGCSEQMKR